MPYQLHEFAGISLGNCRSFDLGVGEAVSGLIKLPGGRVFDAYGATRRPIRPGLLGATAILSGPDSAAVLTAYRALKAQEGARSTLVRISDAGFHESTTANLQSVKARREVGMARHLPVDLTFEIVRLPWSGPAHDISATLVGSPTGLVCPNDGNATVTNAIISVTAPAGGALTTFSVLVAGLVDLYYAAPVPAGHSVVIDCGAHTVTDEGADAYANLSLGAGHLAEDWLPLAPGNTVVNIAWGGTAGGGGRAQFADGFA